MFLLREIVFYVFVALELLIIARVLRDLIQPNPYGSLPRRSTGRSYYTPRHPLVNLVYVITEPMLAPIRRVILLTRLRRAIPPLSMFDITPMVAIIIVGVVQR